MQVNRDEYNLIFSVRTLWLAHTISVKLYHLLLCHHGLYKLITTNRQAIIVIKRCVMIKKSSEFCRQSFIIVLFCQKICKTNDHIAFIDRFLVLGVFSKNRPHYIEYFLVLPSHPVNIGYKYIIFSYIFCYLNPQLSKDKIFTIDLLTLAHLTKDCFDSTRILWLVWNVSVKTHYLLLVHLLLYKITTINGHSRWKFRDVQNLTIACNVENARRNLQRKLT